LWFSLVTLQPPSEGGPPLDIVGFTAFAATREPGYVVKVLNAMFIRFDALAHRLRVEKIKTIGDAYAQATPLPPGLGSQGSVGRGSIFIRGIFRSQCTPHVSFAVPLLTFQAASMPE